MDVSFYGSEWVEYLLSVWSILAATLFVTLSSAASAQQRSPLDSLLELLTTTTGQSDTAPAREWQYLFPRDHHAHESQRAEQWQLLAVTESDAGVRYALNLRMVRVQLNLPETASQPVSGWAFDEVYGISTRLVSLSEPAQWSDTKLARAALGLSGNDPVTGRIWVNQHALHILGGTAEHSSGHVSGAEFARAACPIDFRLSMQIAGQSIDAKFNGHQCAFPDAGLPQLPGYSLPLVLTSGTLGQQTLRSGQGWLLRNWGGLPLSESPVVFDQFYIPLTGDSLLQVLRSRRRDGSGTPVVSAVLHGNGRQQSIHYRDLRVADTHFRESDASDNRYSAGWTLAWPGQTAQIKPVIADQEIDFLGQGQWMGVVSVELASDGTGSAPITRLTGFAELSPHPLEAP